MSQKKFFNVQQIRFVNIRQYPANQNTSKQIKDDEICHQQQDVVYGAPWRKKPTPKKQQQEEENGLL